MTERRSGESLVMVVAMLLPSLVTLLYFVVLAGTAEWLQQAAYAVGKTLQFALPVIWVGLVCRQRLGWPTPTTRGLAGGLGSGLLILVLTLLLYRHVLAPLGVLDAAVANIREKVLELGLTAVWQYVALGVFYSVVHSLLEEYYWRWFVFGRLRRLLQPWPAMWISSGAFMAHHVFILATFFGWMTPWTYLFSLAVAVGGLFWAWLYQRSGSLYGPWLSHMLIDAAIFLIGYDLVGGMFAAA
jgi:uncharacterized protein